MTEKTLNVIWYCPSVLNLHGDRGNVMALERVAAQLGLALKVCRVEKPGDPLPLDDADLLFFAPGQVRDMPVLAEALAAEKEELTAYAAKGGAVLAVGTAGCLLAEETERTDGSRFAGLGLLPMTCREREKVYGDDIWFTTAAGTEIIGCQIQVVDTVLREGALPCGELIYGRGNNGGKDEGCRRDNVIFTNTLGPLLVKNPRFTQALLEQLANRAGIAAETPGAVDTDYEDKSAELIRAFIKKKMA